MNLSLQVDMDTERRRNIVQGEQHIDSDPKLVLTTILGSCIAACLWDPVAKIGGMNHFLLPGHESKNGQVERGEDAMRYGAYSMELLVNGLLCKGAQRNLLQAKLFGGACMMKGLTDVGHLNATFAERFLKTEGILLVGGSLRGDRGRRIQFWPTTGRARQTFVGVEQNAELELESRDLKPRHLPHHGTVELFS